MRLIGGSRVGFECRIVECMGEWGKLWFEVWNYRCFQEQLGIGRDVGCGDGSNLNHRQYAALYVLSAFMISL